MCKSAVGCGMRLAIAKGTGRVRLETYFCLATSSISTMMAVSPRRYCLLDSSSATMAAAPPCTIALHIHDNNPVKSSGQYTPTQLLGALARLCMIDACV